MKTIIYLFTLIIGLSSCSTYKNISKDTAITQETIRATLKPGKKYAIKLISGPVIKMKVTKVDSVNVYAIEKSKSSNTFTGYPFIDSYENLERNTARISIRKVDPLLTAVAIVVPIGFLVGTAVLIPYYSFYFAL
jgi:hypothetical protein